MEMTVIAAESDRPFEVLPREQLGLSLINSTLAVLS